MNSRDPAGGSGPCRDFRIIEVTTMVAGPMCGRILADLGANVLKLEGWEGDIVRTIPPLHKGFSGAFEQWNANKRSLAVDLKSEDGRALLKMLALSADALIENFRPGVAEAMGIGYEALSAQNPKLVYLSVNGFGDDGPYSGQPAYDVVMQGLTGFMPLQGTNEKPKVIRSAVVDKIAGVSGALGIMAALLHREMSGGRGQKLNVNMLDAFAAFILPEYFYHHSFRDDSSMQAQAAEYCYEVFKTVDGHAVGTISGDDEIRQICLALDRLDLLEFFEGSNASRGRSDVMTALKKSAMVLTTEAFLAATQAHGIFFTRVNDINEFLADPQVKHNQTFVEIEDPEFGTVRHMNAFARFSKTPTFAMNRAPKLSEHADDILREFGVSNAAIESYRAHGTIR